MDAQFLIQRHPKLFHLFDPVAWESISTRGLLSTTALLDSMGITGDERAAIEARRRPKIVHLQDATYGPISIRDQKPMKEGLLVKCLEGMTPTEWYQLLNRKVFFWTSLARLETFLCAGPYKGSSHGVLVVDTESLLASHLEEVSLCSINSGTTYFMNPAKRGPKTFLPVAEFGEARGSPRPAELTVEYSVPAIERHLLERWTAHCGQEPEIHWRRPG